MCQDRIMLTTKNLLEKEFKVDTRGYRPQEVDKFLDIVIKDYEEFLNIIKELENEKKDLVDDNIKLRQDIRMLKTKIDAIKDGNMTEVSNADILRRLSSLEKLVYGKDE